MIILYTLTFYYQIVNITIYNRDLWLSGELAEWSNAAVLKTVEPKGSGGSNPSLSAIYKKIGDNNDDDNFNAYYA